jgi:hypothetical protein
MFSEIHNSLNGDREIRLFFIPIESITTPQGQIHRFKSQIPLQKLLGEKYADFKNHKKVQTEINMRVGHPNAKSPTDDFTPKLKDYGLSVGIERVIFTFEDGKLSITTP